MSRMILTDVRIFSAVPVKIALSKVAGTHAHIHIHTHMQTSLTHSLVQGQIMDRVNQCQSPGPLTEMPTMAQHLETSHCRCKIDIDR